MQQEHKVWTVFGYSRVIKPSDAYWNLFRPLFDVLGTFETISFQVLRFGEDFFEITIKRTGAFFTRE